MGRLKSSTTKAEAPQGLFLISQFHLDLIFAQMLRGAILRLERHFRHLNDLLLVTVPNPEFLWENLYRGLLWLEWLDLAL